MSPATNNIEPMIKKGIGKIEDKDNVVVKLFWAY